MSETFKMLLKLINERKTNNEICEILNISNKQLYHYLTLLKNKGFDFLKTYYSIGEVEYCPKNFMKHCECKESNNGDMQKSERDFNSIVTFEKQNTLRCLAISDLHFGSELERIDLVNKAFDYCSKENINIIFCCGDLLEGTFGQCRKKISDPYEQVEYFMKSYPFDKNILTFAVGGNHDYSILQSIGLDLSLILQSYRQDVIMDKYCSTKVNIKNDAIGLYHEVPTLQSIIGKPSIKLNGHHHFYKTYLKNNGTLNIDVPTLSDVNFASTPSIPCVLDMNIKFKNGYFSQILIKQIYLDTVNLIISEIIYDLPNNYEKTKNSIKNIEIQKDYENRHTKKLVL